MRHRQHVRARHRRVAHRQLTAATRAHTRSRRRHQRAVHVHPEQRARVVRHHQVMRAPVVVRTRSRHRVQTHVRLDEPGRRERHQHRGPQRRTDRREVARRRLQRQVEPALEGEVRRPHRRARTSQERRPSRARRERRRRTLVRARPRARAELQRAVRARLDHHDQRVTAHRVQRPRRTLRLIQREVRQRRVRQDRLGDDIAELTTAQQGQGVDRGHQDHRDLRSLPRLLPLLHVPVEQRHRRGR